jgi:hypothetical protein
MKPRDDTGRAVSNPAIFGRHTAAAVNMAQSITLDVSTYGKGSSSEGYDGRRLTGM